MKRSTVMTAPANARELLEDYQAGSSFFMSSPRRTLLAKGVADALSADAPGTLVERATALLQRAKRSEEDVTVLVGAVPFDATRPAQLIVPKEVQWAEPLKFAEEEAVQPLSADGFAIEPVPAPEAFKRGVAEGLRRLEAGELEKIVLSRTLRLTGKEPIDLQQLLKNLAIKNSHGYTFAVDLPSQQAGQTRTLLGASPELLLSKSGATLITNPLAGSRPRSQDPVEDQRRAAELMASEKDLREHAVVIEAIAAALRPFCKTLDVPTKPSLLHTKTMWHLSTVIRGELADPSVSALELAAALHPTPAVCGTPTDLARTAIGEIEPYDRGFYTGMVGWCDSNGDGDWIVTIRCAEAEADTICLYAGAGVVLGSTPEDELAETSAKFRTMLQAMGLNGEQTS